MQEKSVTLTQNKRLARHLQQQFSKKKLSQKTKTWKTPIITSLPLWLMNCWGQSMDTRILLNSFQEKYLWQKIIANNLGEKFTTITDTAMEFHNLVNSWQIKCSDFSSSYITEDIATFQNIHKEFNNYCKNNKLVTISELPHLILPHLSNSNISELKFLGFDEFTPQLQTFISSIEKIGCKIDIQDPNNYQNSIQKRIGFDSQNQEIIKCAEWAKQIISSNDEKTIGVVVPNLEELQPKILQVFTEIMENDIKKVNISAGTP